MRSPEVGRQRVLPWWRNFWFSMSWAPTALKYSGGRSALALYPCTARVRGRLAFKEISGGRSRLKPRPEDHPLSAWTKRKWCNFRRNIVYFRSPKTLPWYRFMRGKCYALHWYQLLHFTPRSFCDQSCSMFTSQPDQICIRCKTSTLFTSQINHSWIHVFL
jgi:hypothetical protein